MIGDFLSEKLKKRLEKNLKKSIITKEEIEKTMQEMKFTLLEADVNIEVVNELINKIKGEIKNEYIENKIKSEEIIIKIIHKELINIFGKTTKEIIFSSNPTIILIVGLQGSGKTTTICKLSKFIKEKYKKNPLLVACDIYRPAGIEQIKTLGKKINIDVFEQGLQNPILTIKNAIKYAEKNKYNTILIDTAGRNHINSELMEELNNIKKIFNPNEILLVIDGMTGQDIINISKKFNELLKLTGVIITKLDGDSRGGAALSVTYLTNLAIKFIGIGEKMNDLEIFHPNRIANRILGMGDLKTLIEKTENIIDKRDIKKTMSRMAMGLFDLQDLLNQMEQIAKIGKMSNIIKLIPGIGNKINNNNIENTENKLKNIKILINSMTIKERRNPNLLKHISRKNRIIKGSGRTEKEYNELINQFEKMKKQVILFCKQFKSEKINFN